MMKTLQEKRQEKAMKSVMGKLSSYDEPRIYPRHHTTEKMDTILTKLKTLSKYGKQ